MSLSTRQILSLMCIPFHHTGIMFALLSRSTVTELNRHRDISLLTTGRILVPQHRIELRTTDYKTVVIPFNYKGVFGSGNGICTHETDWYRIMSPAALSTCISRNHLNNNLRLLHDNTLVA
jgi:hypothetical protein